MNLDICKKCFALKNNVIHYLLIQKYNDEIIFFRLKGLVSDNDINIRPLSCLQEIKAKGFIFEQHFDEYIMNENTQKEILLNIKEPDKSCCMYCEHVLEALQNKELK